jgi:putative adenylate-forming enzyme
MKFKLGVLFYYWRALQEKRKFSKFSTREQLLDWQNQKIQQFLPWVMKHSPFYRKWIGNHLENFFLIPLLTKKNMMENFTELNTAHVSKEAAFEIAISAEKNRNFSKKLSHLTVGLSSGTSGNRGLFLVSDQERAQYVGRMLAKALPGSLFAKNRVAFFMRANSNLYSGSESGRLSFQFFDMLTPWQDHLSALQILNPTLLFAPPSALLMLADAQKREEINISPLKIFSIAETLDPLDAKSINAVFKQPLHQIYQCTEGFLAITCAHGTLHLNEDSVHVEPHWLNEEKTKFSPIITDLYRKTQPIIRYLLNDILTLSPEPCACGSVFQAIESIEGRMDDLLYFKNKKTDETPVSVFPDLIRRAILLASPEIEEYTAEQSIIEELDISFISAPASNRTQIEKNIRSEIDLLATHLKALPPTIHFKKVSPHLGHQKLRRVKQMGTWIRK